MSRSKLYRVVNTTLVTASTPDAAIRKARQQERDGETYHLYDVELAYRDKRTYVVSPHGKVERKT